MFGWYGFCGRGMSFHFILLLLCRRSSPQSIKGRALESEIQALLLKGAIDPPFAWQQGSLTYILSWAFQLAMVGQRCLRVPQSWLVGWLLRPDIGCSMSQGSGPFFLASSAATL